MTAPDTVTEALDQRDAWRAAYEHECAAHAETLRKLEIERILADDFAYALEHAEEIQAAVQEHRASIEAVPF